MRSVVVVVLLVACAAPSVLDDECSSFTFTRTTSIEHVRLLDVLVVVDGSSSMAQESVTAPERLTEVLRAIASGDLDDDGVRDFTPFGSVRVGVVTTDLGGEGATSCEGLGRDAVLVGPLDGCDPGGVAPWIEVGARSRDLDAFSAAVACRLAVSAECGVEQPLEAALRALAPVAATDWTPSEYVSPSFEPGRPGHGDGANAGFWRAAAVPWVIVLTDEDDCSHPGAGRRGTTTDPSCDDAASTWPLQRYVEGLLSLTSPSRLTVTVIAGVPSDVSDSGYDEILADARMQLRIVDGEPAPSCTSDEGRATPPRRLTELLRELSLVGVHTDVVSVCDASWIDALDVFQTRGPEPSPGYCLPRALERDDDGLVPCELLVLLPSFDDGLAPSRCDAAGLTFRSTDTDEAGAPRELCAVPQLPLVDIAGGAVGFAYDDASEHLVACTDGRPRLVFGGLDALDHADVTLRCSLPPARGSACLRLITAAG